MDLLIEFIVWLFKSLTDDKKPASPRRRDEQSREAFDNSETTQPGPRSQRGPYNYGDASAGPKTLEEILEEVRLQRQGAPPAQTAAPVATARPVSAPAQPQPAKRVARQEKQQPKQQPQQRGIRPVEDRSQEKTNIGERKRSVLEGRRLGNTLEQKEIVKPEEIKRRFTELDRREDKKFRPADAPIPEATLSDANNYLELFRVLRTAPPKTRIEMARRAFVFSVVFGPPKSRNSRLSPAQKRSRKQVELQHTKAS